ncbi:hypothetical protein [Lacrimispora saccharolytica]
MVNKVVFPAIHLIPDSARLPCVCLDMSAVYLDYTRFIMSKEPLHKVNV